jgi:hypothetical protein
VEGFDLGQLLQILVVFLFLVLPALKGVAANQKAERERKRAPGPARPARPPAAPRGIPTGSGLEDWKRLLRGEAPLSAPRPPSPPGERKEPAPRAPERSFEGRSLEGRSLEERSPERRSLEQRSPERRSLEQGSLEPDVAAERSLEMGGELGTELAPGELAGTLAAGTGAEFQGLETAATLPPTLPQALPVGRPILERGPAPAALEASRAVRGPALAKAGGWRRAVVLAEVLSPPLALRAGLPGTPPTGALS